jgi:hypothetical protein
MMKNIIIVSICLLLLAISSFAQQTPQFEMPLYFEDALGNKDTLIIGYDDNASSYQLNPQFGEVEITEPYDEFFEVRARKIPFVNPFETKKSIADFGYFPNNECGISSGTTITVRLKYPPLKVSWDKNLLQEDECHIGTFLAPSEHWALVVDLTSLEPCSMYCLYEKEEVIIDFTGQNTSMYSVLNILDSIENVGIDTIQWMNLVFTPQTCPEIIDNVNIINRALKKIPVFPNPTSQYLILDTEKNVTNIQIFNSYGIFLRMENGDSKKLDVQSLDKGVYFGIAELNNGEKQVFKFIKT